MKKFCKALPGILFCAVLAYISKTFANYLPINSLTIGIILGILYSNTVGLHKHLQIGTKYTVKKLLKLGIILLGVELNFVALYQAGPKIIVLAFTVVFLGVFVAPVIGRFLGLSFKLATLLGVGSAICGTSAIVAVAPVIKAQENDTALSVAIISLLGAFGVLIFPLLGSVLNFSDAQFGFWTGSSLQGVAHALAAAGARNNVALEMATYVKMARIVLIAPVSVFLSARFNKDSAKKSHAKIPSYIILFILVAVVSSVGLLNFNIYEIVAKDILKIISKELILWSMIAMGLGVNFSNIKSFGAKAGISAVVIFAIITVVAGVFCFFAF